MEKQWIHENLSIGADGYRPTREAPKQTRGARRQLSVSQKTEEEPQILKAPEDSIENHEPFQLSTFLITTFAIVCICLTPLIILHAKDFSFSVLSFNGADGSFQANSRQEYLARLSFEQQRNFIAHINYVKGIIDTAPRATIDSSEVAFIIVSESYASNLDPLFVASVIKAESAFKHHARSPVGAVGLMQLMPSTGKFIARVDSIKWKGYGALTNPHYNIQLGISYLKYLQTKYKSKRHILMAYNWGPGNVNRVVRTGSTRMPKETRNYLKKVLSYYDHWSDDFKNRKSDFQFGVPKHFKERAVSEI